MGGISTGPQLEMDSRIFRIFNRFLKHGCFLYIFLPIMLSRFKNIRLEPVQNLSTVYPLIHWLITLPSKANSHCYDCEHNHLQIGNVAIFVVEYGPINKWLSYSFFL